MSETYDLGPASATPTAPGDPYAAMLRLRAEIGKVVVGQDGVLSGLLAALLANGHVLLEGVPGTAKTLLVKTLAHALDLRFSRVQFTPDLMPSDVTGQLVLDGNPGDRAGGDEDVADRSGTNGSGAGFGLRFRPGPVFTNLLLADEINRTPPKTQAALLEAMEERQVSVDGRARPLPDPFLVVATQNPVEYEGTYPLPEAQLDRFLVKLDVSYPSAEGEVGILERHHRGLDLHDLARSGVQPVVSPAELALARAAVRAVVVEPVVLQYIVALVRATRDTPSTQLGASPRGAVALLGAAKAWAWLCGRPYVSPDEVKAMASPVLRHRLLLRPELELEGLTADAVLAQLLLSVPAPR